MLRRELITLSEYEKLNNILAEYLDKDNPDKAEKEEEEEEGENRVKRLIQSTMEYLTKDDYDELIHLVPNIKKEAGPEFVIVVGKLRDLIDKFLQDEFDQDGELILPRIMDLVRTLTGSPVSMVKIQQLKMLLNDIDKNRFRVTSILTRLDETEDEQDIVNTLKLMMDDAAFDQRQLLWLLKIRRLEED